MLKTHHVSGITNCIIRIGEHLNPFLLISFYAAERLAASVTLYVAQWQRGADLVGHQNIYNDLHLQFLRNMDTLMVESKIENTE